MNILNISSWEILVTTTSKSSRAEDKLASETEESERGRRRDEETEERLLDVTEQQAKNCFPLWHDVKFCLHCTDWLQLVW